MDILKPIAKSEQESLAAKELQKFFDKVKGVMLIPKTGLLAVQGCSVMCLLVSRETYVNFKDYGVHRSIVDLLDNKFPILSIKIEETRTFVGLSITDQETNLTFRLPHQPMGEALLTFLQNTEHDDKIPLMIGCGDNAQIAFDAQLKSNILLVLDGYIFE